MAPESLAKLRISVWRDYQPARTLAYVTSSLSDVRFFQSDDRLQEEIFAWQVGEGVMSSVADNDVRAKLEEALRGTFSPALPPTSRSCKELGGFLREARQAIYEGKTEWSDSEDQSFADEDEPFRVNTLLAFYNQLVWLNEMFRDEPSVSISIR